MIIINEVILKELERLKNVNTPQPRDKDIVFSLYKSYVNKDALLYTENCSCESSIENIYKSLMTFYDNYLIELKDYNDKKM